MDIHGVLTQKYGCINRGWRTNRRTNTINCNLQGGFNQKKLWGMIWGYNFGDAPWELPSPISHGLLVVQQSTYSQTSLTPPPGAVSPHRFHTGTQVFQRLASLENMIPGFRYEMVSLGIILLNSRIYIYIYTHIKYRICFATNGCESRTNGIKHHYNT